MCFKQIEDPKSILYYVQTAINKKFVFNPLFLQTVKALRIDAMVWTAVYLAVCNASLQLMVETLVSCYKFALPKDNP